MGKLNFQQPLLKSSVSHDPSEIILIYADLVLNTRGRPILDFTDTDS